jgi:hypothetical protein
LYFPSWACTARYAFFGMVTCPFFYNRHKTPMEFGLNF